MFAARADGQHCICQGGLIGAHGMIVYKMSNMLYNHTSRSEACSGYLSSQRIAKSYINKANDAQRLLYCYLVLYVSRRYLFLCKDMSELLSETCTTSRYVNLISNIPILQHSQLCAALTLHVQLVYFGGDQNHQVLFKIKALYSTSFFEVFLGRSTAWMLGRTPPEAMVTLPSSLLSSSSFLTASWMWRGTILLFLLSRAALPASSRISADRYSSTAAR